MRTSTLLLSLTLLLAGPWVPARASEPEPRDTSDITSDIVAAVVSHVVAGATDPVSVQRYWTPRRRAAAVPLDTGTTDRQATDARATTRAARSERSARRSDARRADATVPVPRSVGKLFFSDADGDYVCSASAVRSVDRDQVLTAGHCVHTGPNASGSPLPILGGLLFQPHFFENFLFVPRYRNGARPFGGWVGTTVHVSARWTEQESFPHDQAILEVARRDDGEQLGDVVGMNRIAIGLARVQRGVRAWGWPAESPYDGESAWRCDGRTRAISGGDAVLPCSLNGGASGGPWYVERRVRTRQGMRLRPVIWAVTSRRFLDSPKLLAAPLPSGLRALQRAADAG